MSSLRDIAVAAYRAINDDDLDAFLESVAEDVEFTSLVAEAEGTVYRGHAGAREWWHTVRTAFDDGSWEMVDLEEAGPHAVARIHIIGTIRGVPVEQLPGVRAGAGGGDLPLQRRPDRGRPVAGSTLRRTE